MKKFHMFALALALSGCATIDYCDMTQGKRCEWEGKLETQLNGALMTAGSAALADLVIQCPNEEPCAPVTPPAGTAEKGDFRILTVPVAP